MADWQAIKTEYITTDTSYRKLAEKYGVHHVQIAKTGKAEGWVELKKQYATETLAKTMDAVSQQQAARAARFLTVADKLLDEIEAAMDSEDGIVMAPKDIRALSAAMKDLKEIQDIRHAMDDEEQKARIAKLRREAQEDTDRTDCIDVVFMAGPEEWNE